MSPKLFAVPLPHGLTRRQGAVLCKAADAQKRARYAQYPDRKAPQHSLTAQALLRMAAARELHMPARQVQIAYTEAGQPYLPGLPLYCSVSHTDALCVCALADRPVGVDAERIRPANDRIAKRVFTADEYAALHDNDDYERCFFALWTRHESYVKLCGTGLRDISVPIPAHVDVQTMVWQEEYVISCAMFTESS